jgi:hypothetical protein
MIAVSEEHVKGNLNLSLPKNHLLGPFTKKGAEKTMFCIKTQLLQRVHASNEVRALEDAVRGCSDD